MPEYKTDLSLSGFKKLKAEIRKYKNSLQEKCEEFAYRLAEEGVAVAQLKIGEKDAIYTEISFMMELYSVFIRIVRMPLM